MSETKNFLPYGRHCIEDGDIAAVVSVLRSNSLTGGPMVAEFAGRHGLRVIEDACHAIGATYRTRSGEEVIRIIGGLRTSVAKQRAKGS